MITLVGVGHVFNVGPEVRAVINQRRPSLVCVELDRARYHSLLSGGGKGKAPVAYQMLAKFQSKVADKYDASVGEEMLEAVDAARGIGAKIAFIDMDATRAFTRIWHSMGVIQRLKLMFAAIVGIFTKKERIEAELERFQDDEAGYMEEVAREFPVVKKVLIDDRNRYMANAVRKLSKDHPDVVVVVGDGHIDGMCVLLEDLGPQLIRLRELRSGISPRPLSNITLTESFHEYR